MSKTAARKGALKVSAKPSKKADAAIKVAKPSVKAADKADKATAIVSKVKDKKPKAVEAVAHEHTWAVDDRGSILVDNESARFKVVKLTKKGYKVKWGDGEVETLTFDEMATATKKGERAVHADKSAATKADEPKAKAKADTGRAVTAAELKKAKASVSDFLRDNFGFVDNGQSLYVTPIDSETSLTVFVLGSHDDVLTAMSKIEAETYMISGDVLAVRRHLTTYAEKMLKAGHSKGAISLLYQTTFDPRGMNPDSWTSEELSAFLVAEQIVNAKGVRGMKRELMVEKVTAFGNGTDDGGANAEDATDKVGESLGKMFDRLVANKAQRGKAAERKELIKTLTAYRDDLFDRGRKTRINQLRKMVKELTELADKDREKMLETLSNAAETLA